MGVAISLLVKTPNSEKADRTVQHSDLYGSRETKYELLNVNDLTSTNWKQLQPGSGFYLLSPRDETKYSEYKSFVQVTDIFPVNSTGIKHIEMLSLLTLTKTHWNAEYLNLEICHFQMKLLERPLT